MIELERDERDHIVGIYFDEEGAFYLAMAGITFVCLVMLITLAIMS